MNIAGNVPRFAAKGNYAIEGVQLLCLYALPDPHLIRYYEKTLGFSKLEEPEANFIYGHIKPKYDQDCVFMCRRI